MRRGSVSSWEPWARRNSANMAQVTGSRSEFMTSELELSDIDYKRKGGCFLSYKKTAVLILMFIVGVISAGLIGAYVSSWTRNQNITEMILVEDDEVEDLATPPRFSLSSAIFPSLYAIELTPVIEKTVTKLKGRVVVRFAYNGTQPLSNLVFNARGIIVSKAKLYKVRGDEVPGNNRSRRRRDEVVVEQKSNFDIRNSSDGVIAAITASDVIIANSPMPDDVPGRTFNSSNDIIQDDVVSLTSTPVDVVTLENNVYSEKLDVVSPSSIRTVQVVQRILPTISQQPIPKEIPIAKDEVDTVDDFYVIYPDTPIPGGSYSVEITYEANVDGWNTFSNVYDLEGQTRWLLATRLKPLGARTLFPGFDDLGSKASFSLSIARPNTSYSLSNMPMESSEPVSGDWVMDHFEKTPRMSPHNLVFVVSDLQPIAETTSASIPLTLWSRSSRMGGTRFVVDTMLAVTLNLKQFFSTPYPSTKLDVVALPGLSVDGTGSSGLIFIRESLLEVTEESQPVVKELLVKTLVKLIGEQWLVGSISIKTWNDSWLLEGSLIYLQHSLTDKIDSTFDSMSSFGVDVQSAALEADAYGLSESLESKINPASLDTIYPQNSHRKGACLIRMLHSVISDSGFRNGYKNSLSRWINSSVKVSDLWATMSDEGLSLPDDISLDQVMTSWITQGGFPLVTVTRNYENGSAVIRQEQFVFDDTTISGKQLWYVPLTYVGDGGNWSSPVKSWLKQVAEVRLENVGNEEERKWVLFNVNQTGYYRVNYDEDNWRLLSFALNSSYEKFPVTVRASLVDDALSLAWAGRLNYTTALNLVSYLSEKETHHSPWTAAFQNIRKLNNLLHDTVAYPNFQGFVVKFISPLLKKVTASSGETRLKLMAIKWACLVDNPECRTYMNGLQSVPADLEEIHQCTMAKFGGKYEWDSLFSKASEAQEKEIKLRLLAALPCSRLDWALQFLLSEILEQEKFDVVETLTLLQSFSENPVAARAAFKFVRRHWEEIFDRFSKSYQISKAFLVASMNGITDDQDLKDFQTFKEENYEKLKFMGETIAIVEAQARSKAFWLKTELSSVQAWLTDYITTTS